MRIDDRERWLKLTREPPAWESRLDLIASFIAPDASVVDLGCGAQSLRERLAPTNRYQPVDLVPGTDVIVCNFNAGEFPSFEEPFDVAVASGLLEYILDIDGFLARLPELAENAIITYSPRLPRESRAQRAKRGWLNHLTTHDLHETFERSGFAWRQAGEWRQQEIFVLELVPLPGSGAVRRAAPMINEGGWNERYDELAAHLREAGPAALWPGGPAAEGELGLWVQRQRELWRRSMLERSRARRLQRLPGWSWSESSLTWDAMFERLSAHRGDEPLPPEVARWSEAQRASMGWRPGRGTPRMPPGGKGLPRSARSGGATATSRS